MPVCDPGRTEGGGAAVALYQRPTLAVTSVPAESQQRIPIGYPPKGWCPRPKLSSAQALDFIRGIANPVCRSA